MNGGRSEKNAQKEKRCTPKGKKESTREKENRETGTIALREAIYVKLQTHH